MNHRSATAESPPHSENVTATLLCEAHIRRLWELLPKDSQRRLETLAISTEVTAPGHHATLVGALSELATEEEADFAQIYLGTRAVAESIARGERPTLKRSRYDNKLEKVAEQLAIAIDGEGVTLADGSHVYRYMAAVRSDGVVLATLEERKGIMASQALGFLSNLPTHDEHGRKYLGIFGYGLGYDQTKWFESLSNREIYSLYHDEVATWPPVQVEKKWLWKGPYGLKLLGKCLVVTKRKGGEKAKKKGTRFQVWDILKAFQSTFVKALEAWNVGTPEERALYAVPNRCPALFRSDGEQMGPACPAKVSGP